VEPAPASCLEQIKQSGTRARRNEPTGPQAVLPTAVLTLGAVDIAVEVADDPRTRAAGLMFRDRLAAESGMVFVYPAARSLSFWMRNTCLALSIAYIDPMGRIVSIADMAPLHEQGVPSGAPAMYALEMEQGWFARKGVSVGDLVVGLPPASAH
jgi:uncharacterized membrane protein (UPF0127 family)